MSDKDAIVLSVSAVPEESDQRGAPPTSRYLQQLFQTATTKQDEQFCIWLGENGEQTDERGYLQSWNRAGAVAQLLAEKGLAAGDRAILCFNFGLDFLDTFLGCLRLGVVAVPIYPPNPAKLTQGLEKMALIVADSGAKICLVDNTINTFRRATRGWPEIEYCVPVKAPALTSSNLSLDRSTDDDVAFLQYTSGSTGDPKGVILTFGNIFCNMRLKGKLFKYSSEPDVKGCCWLPQYHDMGLLLCTLFPLAMGSPMVYMSPTTFIKRPVLWLSTMSKHRCTWTVTPNFAYALAARKFSEMEAAKRPQLDLAHVRILGNAAEPVRVATMRHFLEVFAGCGLENAQVVAAYGLAEHTVMVSTGFTTLRDDPALASAVDASGEFVACGEWRAEGVEGATGLVDARIVVETAEGTAEVADGERGEIWLRSPCCGKGYWAMEQRSRDTFSAELKTPRAPLAATDGLEAAAPLGFLRSGDEGFFEQGADGCRRLFVCGRIKDLIIVRGRNIYPQDIERTCETAGAGAVRAGCCAAVQSVSGERELGAVDVTLEVQTKRMPTDQRSALCQALTAAVRQEHAVKVRRLTLLAPRTIPKTTSGKIRRKETRRSVEAGELARHSLMVWEDMTVDEEAEKAAERSKHKHKRSADEEKKDKEEAEEAELAVPETAELFLEWVVCELGRVSEGIGADDAPVELGLDSVSAHEVCHRLSVRLNVEVSPALLLAADTIRGFATLLFDLVHNADQTETDQQSPVQYALPPAADAQSPASLPLSLAAPMLAAPPARAGALAVSARVMIQLVLLWWVLSSLFLCSLPAVIVAERFLDPALFPVPLRLFRALVEPRVGHLVASDSWGSGGPALILPDPPTEPLLSNPYAAAAVGVPLAFASFVGALAAYTVALKWLLLGRVRAGDYPLWGWLYWRRWLVARHAEILVGVMSLAVHDAAPLSLLYSLLGARIGRRARLDCSLASADWDLVAAGAGCSAARSAHVFTSVVVGGTLHLRAVEVGERCELQDKAVLCPGASLPPRTRIRPNTVIAPDSLAASVPGRTLEGRPATEVGEDFEGAEGASWFEVLLLPVAWLLCLLCSSVLCLLPVVTVSHRLLRHAELSGPGLAAAVVGQYVLYLTSLCVVTLAAKWCLLGRRLRRGACVVRGSWLEVRKECVERLNGLVHRLVLVYLWGGEWINLWYRLLGARIAPGTVLSVGTALGSDWDAIDIGAHCMLGGNTIFKTSVRSAGAIEVQGVRLGHCVTTGAGSTIGAGCQLGDFALVTSMSSVAAGSEVAAHAYVVGSAVRQRLHRCFTPPEAQGGHPKYVLEVGVWVAHAAALAVSLWVAIYAVWALRDKARVPGLALFPLGGGLFQLMRVLLILLAKWTVCRHTRPAPATPLPDDFNSVDDGASVEGGDVFWFPSFRVRGSSRELSPEGGSRRSWMGMGSAKRASREPSPEPGAHSGGGSAGRAWRGRHSGRGPHFGSGRAGSREGSSEPGGRGGMAAAEFGESRRLSAEYERAGEEVGGGGELGLAGLAGFYQELYLRHWYNMSLLGGCLKGGPLANIFFKCARTGQMPMSAYLGSMFLFDFEFLDIGEDVAINEGVSVTPHVINSTTSCRFERVVIGDGATLWPTARCMGRTHIPPGAQVAPLSRMDPAFHAHALRELSRVAASGLASSMLVGVPAVSFVATGLDEAAKKSRHGNADAEVTIAVSP